MKVIIIILNLKSGKLQREGCGDKILMQDRGILSDSSVEVIKTTTFCHVYKMWLLVRSKNVSPIAILEFLLLLQKIIHASLQGRRRHPAMSKTWNKMFNDVRLALSTSAPFFQNTCERTFPIRSDKGIDGHFYIRWEGLGTLLSRHGPSSCVLSSRRAIPCLLNSREKKKMQATKVPLSSDWTKLTLQIKLVFIHKSEQNFVLKMFHWYM